MVHDLRVVSSCFRSHLGPNFHLRNDLRHLHLVHCVERKEVGLTIRGIETTPDAPETHTIHNSCELSLFYILVHLRCRARIVFGYHR